MHAATMGPLPDQKWRDPIVRMPTRRKYVEAFLLVFMPLKTRLQGKHTEKKLHQETATVSSSCLTDKQEEEINLETGKGKS